MFADPSPMALNPSARWDPREDKIFENCLAEIPDDCAEKWQLIAQRLPGKSPEDVKAHYEVLLYDLWQIETGKIQPPIYPDETVFLGRSWSIDSAQISPPERKKGNPWTKDEHELFLIGLQRYGKGDWRSISRNVIVTKTPTQVASHAQKYFLRQSEIGRKQKKRSSIHDVTMSSVMDSFTVPAPRPNLPAPGQINKFRYFPSDLR